MAGLCVLLLAAAVAAVVGQGQVCPDGTRCSDGSCCMTVKPNRPYGCCPFLNAVCCADMLHCCPENYHCDLAHGMCVPGPAGRQLQRLLGWGGAGRYPVPLAAAAAAVVAGQCPDGKTTCSAEATCCQLQSGGYACCPEPNAVCCADHIHCCPAGTKCDVKDRACIKTKKHAILSLF